MLCDLHRVLGKCIPSSKRAPCGSLALFFVILLSCGLRPIEAQEAKLVAPTAIEHPVAEFTLRDFGGKPFALADAKQSKCVVVAFLGAECPLAKLYAPRLQSLADDYRSRGVTILGIDSNAQDSIAELAAYARQHKIDFPLLKDPGAIVADQFGARRTPEVFVLDQQRIVRYHGRIDDQYGIGFMRPKPKRQDLRIALDELLAGTAVSQPITEPSGCVIGRPVKPEKNSPVTFSNQISRIFNQHCVECHRPGEIGPFALTDYKEVAGWAATIAEVVAAGRMPPWHANPKYGKFADDRSLSSDEKRLIAEWVAAGAPEGSREQLPESRKFLASGWQLSREPDAIIPMSSAPFTVPAEGLLDYQFFTVDPGYREDKWFVAAEIMPGNRSVVHHLSVFAFVKDELEALLDGTSDGYLVAYVPGMRAKSYPEGMAKRIPAGSKLVFQVHYTPNGSEQLDCSKLGLLFVDPGSVQYEVLTGSVIQRTLVIPPRVAHYRVSGKSVRSPRESYLLSMMPHMHLRGASFNYEILYPNGKIATLLDVPSYDSNWQTSYRLLEPLALPAGSRLRGSASFDNSEDNLNNPDPSKTVRWGLQSRDEMMVGYFDIAVRQH
jgi:peroxiredoxin